MCPLSSSNSNSWPKIDIVSFALLCSMMIHIYILKELANSIPSPSGRSIRPISLNFFLNERYLCVDMSSRFIIHLPPTLLKLYSNATQFRIFP